MIRNYIENANFEDTGFSYTLSLISGKYKMVILYIFCFKKDTDCILTSAVAMVYEYYRIVQGEMEQTRGKALYPWFIDHAIL